MIAFELCLKEESPGSLEIQRRVIPGRGDSRESATENIPLVKVRVKRCGKSAPLHW